MLQLPKDAAGIWIDLDTTTMYRKNGNQFHVSDFFYEARADKWYACCGGECVAADKLYLEIKVEAEADISDSWEKLETDLKRVIDCSHICAYDNKADSSSCDECKLLDGKSCLIVMCSDILNRISNLRGENHDC